MNKVYCDRLSMRVLCLFFYLSTGSDDAMQIVNALLEVTSHSEFDISSMTFNFWHHLMRNLTDRYHFTK